MHVRECSAHHGGVATAHGLRHVAIAVHEARPDDLHLPALQRHLPRAEAAQKKSAPTISVLYSLCPMCPVQLHCMPMFQQIQRLQ